MMIKANWLSSLLLLIPILSFSKLRVTIVDTGIRPGLEQYYCDPSLNKDFTGMGLHDYVGHGTNIAWLITKDLSPNDICFIVVKWYDRAPIAPPSPEDGLRSINAYTNSLDYAVNKTSPDFLNLSLEGSVFVLQEYSLIKKAIETNVQVAVAAGNGGNNLDIECNSFPACLAFDSNLFFVVGSLSTNGDRLLSSNYGKLVRHWAVGLNQGNAKVGIMTGTSQATANFTNYLIKKRIENDKKN